MSNVTAYEKMRRERDDALNQVAEERQKTGKKKGNEKGEVSRNLPRNYRQIGEPGAKKIYVEDYVYTSFFFSHTQEKSVVQY